MAKQSVWRLEDQKGDGIYVSGAARRAGMPTDFSRQHPNPVCDRVLGYSNKRWTWKYCFAKLDDLLRWAYESDWFEALEAEGVVVAEYEALSFQVVKGDGQAVFDHEMATRVRIYSPTAMLYMLTS